MKTVNNWINNYWLENEYSSMKENHFEKINSFFNRPFNKILDIGCGLAFESRKFQQHYNSELYLIDGDFDNNTDAKTRHNGWDFSSDNMKFYSSFSELNNFFKEQQIKNYHLINCNNIRIPNNIKFDLISSYLSCGHHYPLSEYKDLILKHSDDNTVLLFTLRKPKKNRKLEEFHQCNVLDIIYETPKWATAQIKF